VTFDHLVPADDPNPEVLAISIIEVDNDGGAFTNKFFSFPVDPTEYMGRKFLTVPRRAVAIPPERNKQAGSEKARLTEREGLAAQKGWSKKEASRDGSFISLIMGDVNLRNIRLA